MRASRLTCARCPAARRERDHPHPCSSPSPYCSATRERCPLLYTEAPYETCQSCVSDRAASCPRRCHQRSRRPYRADPRELEIRPVLCHSSRVVTLPPSPCACDTQIVQLVERAQPPSATSPLLALSALSCARAPRPACCAAPPDVLIPHALERAAQERCTPTKRRWSGGEHQWCVGGAEREPAHEIQVAGCTRRDRPSPRCPRAGHSARRIRSSRRLRHPFWTVRTLRPGKRNCMRTGERDPYLRIGRNCSAVDPEAQKGHLERSRSDYEYASEPCVRKIHDASSCAPRTGRGRVRPAARRAGRTPRLSSLQA